VPAMPLLIFVAESILRPVSEVRGLEDDMATHLVYMDSTDASSPSFPFRIEGGPAKACHRSPDATCVSHTHASTTHAAMACCDHVPSSCALSRSFNLLTLRSSCWLNWASSLLIFANTRSACATASHSSI